MQKSARLATIVALAVAAPLLAATPATASDSWYYFEGGKKNKHERLYVREQGRGDPYGPARLTVYWFLHQSDAGPLCVKGKQSTEYYDSYHGQYTFNLFPSGQRVTKPTWFSYQRLQNGRKVKGYFWAKPIPQNGGWYRAQLFTGLPKHARGCFK